MMSGRWRKKQRVLAILRDTASVPGVVAIGITFLQFFPSLQSITYFLQQKEVFWLLAAGSLIYGLLLNRPRNEFVFKIHNRDVEVALKVGNIEDINAAYVVPVNSEFDMHLNGSVGVSKSVQQRS